MVPAPEPGESCPPGCSGQGSEHRWEIHLVPVTTYFQAKLRLEMEMERMRQTHSKEMESRDEEVEEARQSCQKKVRQWARTCPV